MLKLNGNGDGPRSLEIQDFLRAEGVELRPDAECITVRKEAEGHSVGLS
jgi:hypothetical protein